MNVQPRLRAGLYHYLFEFVVIVTGVTISFALNEWRQDRDGKESLRRDLESIAVNLESDRAELVALIDMRKEVVPSMRWLLACSDEMTGGEKGFTYRVREMLDGAGFCFYPDSGAWRAVVASGNLRWIDNQRLQSALFEYYDHAVPRIADNNRLADDVMVNGLIAWLAGEFPVKSGMDEWLHAGGTIGDASLDVESWPAFRSRIGAALPHTAWYEELLQITLEQLEDALDAVYSSLGGAGS